MKISKMFISALLSSILLFGTVGCATDNGGIEPTHTTENTTAAQADDKKPDKKPSADAEQDPDNTDKSYIESVLESKFKLRFGDDGDFKVMVFADLHLNSKGMSNTNEERIKMLLEREKPDLVILTGDQIHDRAVSNADIFEKTISQVADIFEEKEIPWIHVYGNHDDNGGFSKEKQQEIYENFEHCLSKAGDEELTGVGNYVIPIYASDSDSIKFAVWGLDSGGNISTKDKSELCPVTSTFGGYSGTGYDYIHEDQINWYYETSKLLEAYNNDIIVPSLMAFHIPLQETWTAWQNRSALEYTGDKREDICASAYNSGLFGVMRGRGDVKAVVNGHDHKNDFMVKYGGIKLCYSPTLSDSAYGVDEARGCRVFVINESTPNKVDTYVSYLIERAPVPDVGPLPVGYTCDFEGTAPEFTVTSFNNAVDENAAVDTIDAKVIDGKGVGGSKALAVTRTLYIDNKGGQNIEVKWSLDSPGKLGDNKYIVVWMDLESQDVDFRKACFGLFADNIIINPYTTDNYGPCPFYYKAEGSDTWVEYSMGNDGCFGAGEKNPSTPVRGFKGWFAFPVECMLNSGNSALNSNSTITGFYFYMSLKEESMIGKYVYLDNFTLIDDYKNI